MVMGCQRVGRARFGGNMQRIFNRISNLKLLKESQLSA